MKQKLYGTIIMLLVLVMGLSLSSTTAAYIENQDEVDKAYKKAYNNILDEKWSEAIQSFEKFTRSYPKSRWVDDAEYWQCYAREQKGESLEKTFDCYQDFIKRHSKQ